jgi:hypothetical protein
MKAVFSTPVRSAADCVTAVWPAIGAASAAGTIGLAAKISAASIDRR